MKKLLRHRFFTVSILPNLIFVFILLVVFASSGKLSASTRDIFVISDKTNALAIFRSIRLFLTAFYLGYLLYEVYNMAKAKSWKGIGGVLGRGVVGLILATWAFFIAALIYDFISIFLLLIFNREALKSN